MNKKLILVVMLVAFSSVQYYFIQASDDTSDDASTTSLSIGNGFFGSITNELGTSYYVQGANELPIQGNGAATNIGPSLTAESGVGSQNWGSYKFSDLWEDNVITLAPSDSSLAPTITFTFNDTSKTITINVSYDTASLYYTYYINLIPIQNILNNENILPDQGYERSIPMPTDWRLDFTITSDLTIVINKITTLSSISLYDYPIGLFAPSMYQYFTEDMFEDMLEDMLETFKEKYPAPLNILLTFTPNATSKEILPTVPTIPALDNTSQTITILGTEITNPGISYFPLTPSLSFLMGNQELIESGEEPKEIPDSMITILDTTLLQESSTGGLCGLDVIISDQDTNPTCDSTTTTTN